MASARSSGVCSYAQMEPPQSLLATVSEVIPLLGLGEWKIPKEEHLEEEKTLAGKPMEDRVLLPVAA